MTIASIAVVDEPGLTPERRLALALRRAGFWRTLRSALRRAKCEPAQFRVLIKPELAGFNETSAAATNPRLVESLIDLLHDAQYTNVLIGASADSSALWAENRDVLALADLSGYRFVTAKGRPYEVRDLSAEQSTAPFSPGDLLADSTLSSTWLEANFRIVFAKNRTDTTEGYSLCLESLLGALPLVDKDYHYRLRQSAGEVVAELLRATPLHFAIIDAVVSAHGSGAARAPRPIETNCIIAATDVQLADHIGALKMGADPAISRIWSAVTARRPMPKKYSLHGELRVYPGWRNVNPVLVDSARKRNASTTAQRLTAPWLQTLDPTMFPLKSPVDAQVNASVAPLFANLDDDPGALSTLVLLNHLIAASARTLDMYRTIFDKDALQHIHVPLGLNLGEYPPAAYAAIYPELAALAPLLADLPEQAAGLKWRYIDEAVVFQYTRTIPVDFDTFVSKVDVARTIQYLNDYIGGVIVPVEHDRQGRVTRQAERNVYLPQPNYVVLADGKPIDVSKLETVYYADGLHRMCWKTVKSENESAKSDDGIVTFERDANAPAQTIVTILGKQLFVLPPFWQAMSLDLNPDLRAHLVTDAYRTFFDRSVANLEALLEDRDIRIGKAWHQPTTPDDHAPPPSQSVERIVSQTISRVKDWLPQTNLASPPAETGAADDNGFVHFSASTAQLSPALETQNSATAPTYSGLPTTMGSVTRFWTGLAESISRDLGNGTRK